MTGESVTYLAAFGGGIVSFLSPLRTAMVPAYLSVITGLDITEAERGGRHQLARVARDTGLFVFGPAMRSHTSSESSLSAVPLPMAVPPIRNRPGLGLLAQRPGHSPRLVGFAMDREVPGGAQSCAENWRKRGSPIVQSGRRPVGASSDVGHKRPPSRRRAAPWSLVTLA